MCMMMSGVVFSFVHAVVLLAISFFILLAVRKLDSQNIKTFGYVIAVLLWVAAALVLGKGVSVRHPMFHRMHMMGEKYPEVSQHVEQAAPTK